VNYHPPNPPPNYSKIIVNPKFFPVVHHQEQQSVAVQPTQSLPEPKVSQCDYQLVPVAKPKVTSFKPAPINSKTTWTKPNPIRLSSSSGDRSRLKLNLSNNPHIKSKYKWKKVECSPHKPKSKQVYKLIRKTPLLKPPKLATLLMHRPADPLKWRLTPPKLTSTPLGSSSAIGTKGFKPRSLKSRFKLDNRMTKKKLNTKQSPSKNLPKILQTKYRLVRNKLANRSSVVGVNRSFTNFKSSLTRPNLKLNRLISAKPVKKTVKVSKSAKKQRKRYYDEEESKQQSAVEDTSVLDESVEIGEKPSGTKNRAPLGLLPSFITL
jgi:hypothetical protein